MNLFSNNLLKVFESHGYYFKRGKGSHQVFYNPLTNNTVIVHAKDLKKGTYLGILKQAELDKDEM